MGIMDATTLLYIIIGIITFDFIVERTLDILNLRALRYKLPESLSGVYKEEKYQKSMAYTRENARFSFVMSAFYYVVAIVLLLTGFFGWLDATLRFALGEGIFLSIAFFGLLFIVSDIVNIPFQWYETFVIEKKYEFNKTTPKIFFTDKLKGYLLAAILGGGILYVLLLLIQYFGQNFWFYFWLIISAFTLFMNMFYTTLILPLFNKLTPLENGSLKAAIENYSQKVNFPLDNIYVMDGSKRSNKSNAFFSGIGKKKKIVLFDTLIENHSEEELVAVLAHEVGHYKRKHIITSYMTSIVQTGIILFLLSLVIFNPTFSKALGGAQNAIHLNLIAFTLLFSPISNAIGIFMNLWSRKNEFEADAYARDTYSGKALESALKKLSMHNLSNLTPHPAYVFVHYSHPPLLQRLKALHKG
jgi:STE24 endopeptidase